MTCPFNFPDSVSYLKMGYSADLLCGLNNVCKAFSTFQACNKQQLPVLLFAPEYTQANLELPLQPQSAPLDYCRFLGQAARNMGPAVVSEFAADP